MRVRGTGLGLRTLSRFALIGVIGGSAAGCSTDASRLGDPFGNPFASNISSEPSATGSLPEEGEMPAAPAVRTSRIQSQSLGAPMSPRPLAATPPMATGRVASTAPNSGMVSGMNPSGMNPAGMNPDAGRGMVATPRTVPAAPPARLPLNAGAKAAEAKARAEAARAEAARQDSVRQEAARKEAAAKAVAEARTATEARKIAEANKVSEAKRAVETKKLADAKLAADAKKLAETKKLAEVKKPVEVAKAETPKVDPAKAKAEAARKAAEAEAKLAKAEAAKDAAKKVAEAKAAEKAKAAPVKVASLTPVPEKAEPASTGSVAPAAPAAEPDQSFRWPAKGRVISGYGTSGNEGINISVPEGTAVKAAEDGTVAYAGSDVKGYGKLVLVRHTNGYVSAYAHNGELDVRPGEKVKRGQTIAKSGASGNVTSPQLHFEIRKGATPVDPMPHLASN
ncbi:murein hydrolase activator EnvC family protein [Methylobacterium sp. CM6247]